MAPRRPSTAPSDPSPQRIPFVAAEALLWWPELRKQHAWLLTEMRALQSQHDGYNSRIQATEAVAESAEAATSRIRHMEQQLQAMEAVDKDRTFEEWVAAEITQLKIFVERNGAVRQKQMEMEKEVERMREGAEGWGGVAGEVRELLRRVEGLEVGRKMDRRKIEVLEKELRAGGKGQDVGEESALARGDHGQTSRRLKISPRVLDLDDSDHTTETEDEGPVRFPESAFQKVHLPRSPLQKSVFPEIKSSGPRVQAPVIISARQRLFKRPSIHNSKLPKDFVERTSIPVVLERRAQRTAVLPTSQLVERTNLRKRKEPEPDIYTERITRSQFKNQESNAGQTEKSRTGLKVAVEPTVTKRKRPDVAPTLSTSVLRVGQPMFGRVKEQNRPTTVQGRGNLPEATQSTTTSPKKRRKLDDLPSPRPTQVRTEDANVERPLQYAQDVLKSPRKGASRAIACIPCRQRHVACDRTRPTCGECAKRSVACHYADSAGMNTQVPKTKPTNPQKKPVQKNAIAVTSQAGAKTSTKQAVTSHIPSPKKPKVSADTVLLPSAATSSTTSTSKRRTMLEITDYETYLKLRAEDKIP